MAEEVADETNSLEQIKKQMQYALIKNCDMNEEMRSDAVDLVISATEKYQANYELAARMVKDQVRSGLWPSAHGAPDAAANTCSPPPPVPACTQRICSIVHVHVPTCACACVVSCLSSASSRAADGQEVQLELDRGDWAGLLL